MKFYPNYLFWEAVCLSLPFEEVHRQSSFIFADAPDEDKYSVCVHCGFCLEVCPTYQEWSDENHSPRGRVYLIKQTAEGHLTLNEDVMDPVFTCLDCRACESVCPSGVQVGALIEEARGQVFYANPKRGWRGWLEQLFLREIFPHPKRLQKLRALTRFYQVSGLQTWVRRLGLLRILPRHLQALEAAMPEVTVQPLLGNSENLPMVDGKSSTRKNTGEKGKVALFTGCVMDVFYTHVHEATAEVLLRNHFQVHVPSEQKCCGALQVHAGDRDTARSLARKNIQAFLNSDADYIVVNAAGCGALLKEYPELFRNYPEEMERAELFASKVRDISELLFEKGWEPPKGELCETVAYHDACHLCHAQKIRHQPRALLASIPGLQLVDLPDADRCCGSAGIYNLTHPEMAQRLLERKLADIPDDVSTLAMGNPGCLLQISSGLKEKNVPVKVVHTVELLQRAYRMEGEGEDGAAKTCAN